jgi:DNA-binding transcriptional regulator YiaG
MAQSTSTLEPRALHLGDNHTAMTDAKPPNPKPDAVRQARQAVGLTQTEAAKTVSASMRAWQQWESGERAMPPGLFELFMLKTRQWSLNSKPMTE